MDHSSTQLPGLGGFSPMVMFLFTLIGSVLTQMTKEDIVFWITVIAGIATTINAVVKTWRDWPMIRARIKSKRQTKTRR